MCWSIHLDRKLGGGGTKYLDHFHHFSYLWGCMMIPNLTVSYFSDGWQTATSSKKSQHEAEMVQSWCFWFLFWRNGLPPGAVCQFWRPHRNPVPSLKLLVTASLHLKMDGWNIVRILLFPFGWMAYFQILLLLVSGSVSIWICKDTRSSMVQWRIAPPKMSFVVSYIRYIVAVAEPFHGFSFPHGIQSSGTTSSFSGHWSWESKGTPPPMPAFLRD